MFYVCFAGKRVIGWTDKFPFTADPKKFTSHVPEGTTKVSNRNDWKSFEEVCAIARALTAITGESYVGTDAGDHVSPRYDIGTVPKIGDPVSYAFNGDYYPDGEVVRITKGLRITTSTGKVYNRYKNTGCWMMVGGTWQLVHGHISRQNPSF